MIYPAILTAMTDFNSYDLNSFKKRRKNSSYYISHHTQYLNKMCLDLQIGVLRRYMDRFVYLRYDKELVK